MITSAKFVSVNATDQELKTRGVEVSMDAQEAAWGWWAQFKDPDGTEYGLGQSGE